VTGSGALADPGDVLGAVRVALAELDLDGEDQAAIALALRLGSAIDAEESGRTLAELAGKLLAVLTELGATPAARKSIVPQAAPSARSAAQLAKDELKARRVARQTDGTG
jgi:hypothetical protein